MNEGMDPQEKLNILDEKLTEIREWIREFSQTAFQQDKAMQHCIKFIEKERVRLRRDISGHS